MYVYGLTEQSHTIWKGKESECSEDEDEDEDV